MAEKKGQAVIIKKVQGGGHGGHHGGAWKVAYADFVTAMMAFFLVMWLMGTDEETKAAISHYFNNPSSALRPDLGNATNIPLGEKTGAGENVLNGADGRVPEDLIDRPMRDMNPNYEDYKKLAEIKDLKDRFPGQDLNIEVLKFSVSERLLFEDGSDKVRGAGEIYLNRIATLMKGFQGNLTVEASTFPEPRTEQNPYDFSIARVVSVGKYLVKTKALDEERFVPKVANENRALASSDNEGNARGRERYLNFTLEPRH